MEKLKEVRIKHGYTHAKMAEFLNISKPFYWQIENNKRKLSYEMAVKISKIFKTTPDKIFYNEFKSKD